jgi:3-oxoadipate enol-lactonase
MLDVGGGRLHYEVDGEGPAVLLLHPGLWDSRTWDPQFPVFAERFRTIRFDFRGFGGSDKPTEPFSMFADVRSLLDGLGVDRAAVVGVSLGGAVALEFTIEHPDRVSALVPVASGLIGFKDHSPELKDVWERSAQALEAGDLTRSVEIELEAWAPMGTEDAVGRLIHDIAVDNAGVELIDDELYLSPETPTIERLSEITCPTLVVTGDRDVPEMEAIAKILVSDIPEANHASIHDADHVVNLRQPDEFNRIVIDFLTTVVGSGT